MCVMIPYHLSKSHLRKTVLRKSYLRKIDCANLVCANLACAKPNCANFTCANIHLSKGLILFLYFLNGLFDIHNCGPFLIYIYQTKIFMCSPLITKSAPPKFHQNPNELFYFNFGSIFSTYGTAQTNVINNQASRVLMRIKKGRFGPYHLFYTVSSEKWPEGPISKLLINEQDERPKTLFGIYAKTTEPIPTKIFMRNPLLPKGAPLKFHKNPNELFYSTFSDHFQYIRQKISNF